MTNDPELAAALGRVAAQFSGVPAARVVRDLAIKGAEVLEREQREREEAIERLVAFSTQRQSLIDWDVLERVDELAWGD